MRIISALGRHRQGLGRDEIARAVGCVSSGGFTAQLEDLEGCGFIRRYLPVGGENSGVYRLADAFSLFCMTFVDGNPSRDGIANLCEMKYSANEFVIDKQEDANVANRVAAFRKFVGSKRTIHVTLVTVNGLKHNVYWNNVQSEIGLDDLFA